MTISSHNVIKETLKNEESLEETMIYEEKTIETIPVGPLGLIPLKSCAEIGKKVDKWLVDWRQERESEHKSTIDLLQVKYHHLVVHPV